MPHSKLLNLTKTLAVGGLAFVVAGFSMRSVKDKGIPKQIHTGWRGDPDNGGWLPCNDSKPIKPAAAVTVLHAKVTTQQGAPFLDLSGNDATVYRNLYRSAFATCFLDDVDADGPSPGGVQQYNQSQDTVIGTVVVRLRPARFTHKSDYRTDLAPGTGYFVADLLSRLGTRATGGHANGKEILAVEGSSTLLWYGRDDTGRFYVAELDLQSFPNTLPDDSPPPNVVRLGTPVEANHTNGKVFSAAFGRFHEPMGRDTTSRDIPDGTWVTCGIGCCVASNMIAMQ